MGNARFISSTVSNINSNSMKKSHRSAADVNEVGVRLVLSANSLQEPELQ